MAYATEGQNRLKASCLASTTGNIADLAAGAPDTVDGVALSVGERVLVWNQSTASQNGIYVVVTLGTGSNGSWSRATDADQPGEIRSGDLVYVRAGTQVGLYNVTTVDPITVGSTSLVYEPVGGAVATGDVIDGATAGSVLFAGVGGALSQDNANLFWDDSNNRLVVGGSSSNERLTVNGTVSLLEGAAPSATASYGKIYVQSSDSNLYFMDDSGTSYLLNSQFSSLDDGTALLPSLAFSLDPDTGIYRVGTNTIGVSTSGVLRWSTSATQHTSTLSIVMDVGTGGGAGVVRSGTGDAFAWEAGGPSLRASSNNKLTATAAAIETTVPVRVSDGAVGAPSISFLSDTNSGHWLAAPDTLATSTGGVERVRMSTTEVVFNDPGNDYDFRVEGDTDANLLFVDAGLDRVAIGSASPTAKLLVAGGSLASTIPALAVTGTLSSVAASQVGVDVSITSAGSGGTDVRGGRIFLLAGYSGSGSSYGLQTSTQATGTATGGITSVIGGNFGTFSGASATTTGHNFGSANYAALSSTLNVGSTSFANVSTGAPERQVGAFGAARHGSVASVGMMATLYDNNSGPTVLSAINASAALVADNADTTHPIFLARDNANTVFTIADGSGVNSFGSTEVVFNDTGADIDFRVESDTQTHALFLDASSDTGAGRWGFFDSTPDAKVDIEGGTLPNGVPALAVTGTVPDVASNQIGANVDITANGTTSGGRQAFLSKLGGTSTTASFTAGLSAVNEVPGTVANMFGISTFGGNYAVRATLANSSTTGHNAGVYSTASGSSTYNVGVYGVGYSTAAAAVSIGTFGGAQSSAGVSIGGFFRNDNTGVPAALTSAALMADNVATTDPIFVGRDNGAIVFQIVDGGDVAMGGSHAPLAKLHISDAASSTVLVEATGGASWAEARVEASAAFIYSYADASVGDVGIIMSPAEGAVAAHIAIDSLASAVDLIIQGANSKAVIFNESGGNVDLRVEGDTNVNLLFVDASADMVSIAHNAPASRLDVDGSLGLDVTSTSAATFNLDATHHTLLVDASGAAVTVNLPAASGVTRRRYEIKKTDSSSNTVTIDGNSAETIDGAATYVLSTQYQSITIVCDGSNWFIV